MVWERVKLISITKSHRKNKRFVADFLISGPDRVYHEYYHFGAPEPNTYIDHGDKERRRLFLARTTNYPTDPMTPAILSRSILWGESTSMKKNIELYKQHYGL